MTEVTERLARELAAHGIRDARVLEAVACVPRELFVAPSLRAEAGEDRPLAIGHGQTISQPYIVAYMTELLGLTGRERVLEVGTGSGYQTAILARLAGSVSSVEIVPELAWRAAGALGRLGVSNVRIRVGDGWKGWPEEAPFDRVIVTAAPDTLPPRLVAQLAPGGRMVVPLGREGDEQTLTVVDRGVPGGLTVRDLIPVRFVPMTGGAGA